MTVWEKGKRARTADPREWIAAGYSGEGMVHVWLCSRALALMVLGLENARGMEVEGRYSTGQKCKQVVADLLPNSCSALERCRQGVDSESL